MRDTFGERLRAWREAAGVFQDDVAAVLLDRQGKPGTNKSYVSQIERGVLGPPSEAECREIARVVKAPEAEVLAVAAESKIFRAFGPKMGKDGKVEPGDPFVLEYIARREREAAQDPVEPGERDLVRAIRSLASAFNPSPRGGADTPARRVEVLAQGDSLLSHLRRLVETAIEDHRTSPAGGDVPAMIAGPTESAVAGLWYFLVSARSLPPRALRYALASAYYTAQAASGAAQE